jgi:TonB family protein
MYSANLHELRFMVHTFVSSPTKREQPVRIAGASLSVVLHAVLIGSAVAATSISPVKTLAGDVHRVRREEFVRYVRTVPPAADAAPRPAERSKTRATPRFAALRFPGVDLVVVPNLEIAEVPEIDLRGHVANAGTDELAGPGLSALIAGALRGMIPIPINGAYSATSVERVVAPRRDNPRPAYPTSMLAAGIETSVAVSFVVDSTGRVDEKSMVAPSNAHRLFVDAIKRALKRSRFYPAELAGQRVAQLVRQEFVFRIER